MPAPWSCGARDPYVRAVLSSPRGCLLTTAGARRAARELDEAQVRAAMRASVKLKGSQAVAMGEDGMYELTAAYDKVRKRL